MAHRPVTLAGVIGAHGVTGEVRLKLFAEGLDSLSAHKSFNDGALTLKSLRPGSNGTIARFAEVADRNAAEALRGSRVFVSRASFPTARAGEYYWIDLIGLAVVNRQGEALGSVADLIETGAHSVLRVTHTGTAADGKLAEVERLIPFVAAYIDDVSFDARRITVDWGLDF